MTTHEQIVLAYMMYVKEAENFEKNNVKVSAVRARQALKDLAGLTTQRRKEIQDKKDSA